MPGRTQASLRLRRNRFKERTDRGACSGQSASLLLLNAAYPCGTIPVRAGALRETDEIARDPSARGCTDVAGMMTALSVHAGENIGTDNGRRGRHDRMGMENT